MELLIPDIKLVTVYLTNSCNLNCKHCYVSSSPKGQRGLESVIVKRIIDTTAKIYSKPLFTLTGGEALVRLEDCLDLLDYAHNRVDTQLLTNATLITREVAEKLAKLNISIRISLDGDTAKMNDAIRGKGTFVRILNGIELLLSEGFPQSRLGICATLFDSDEEVILRYGQLCERLGVSNIRFHALCRMGRGANLATRIYGVESAREIRHHKKPFVDLLNEVTYKGSRFSSVDSEAPAFNEISIYSNGEVYPYIVNNYLAPRQHELSAGNVNQVALDKIISGKKMSESILVRFLALNRQSNIYSRAFTANILS